MADKPRKTEEEIAREYNDKLAREFTRKKLTSVLVVVVFVVLGALALAYRLPMLTFSCFMIALIGAIRY